MAADGLTLEPVAPACGAEVGGVDLGRPLDAATVATLEAALAERGVLFFRDQQLTAAGQKELARQFGPLHLHPTWPRLVPGHPEVMEIYTDAHSERIAGENWHSDVSCDPRPPLGTLLYLVETPPVGGDTLFANMCAAFAALSPPLREFLAGLTAVHDGEQVYRRGYGQRPAAEERFPRSVHPVVRTHPVTRHPALFVNRTFTTGIVELAPRESAALLEMLFAHIEEPRFQCRFSWEAGSVALWDNRCVQHLALWDYYPHRRRGLRVTIAGDAPFYEGGAGRGDDVGIS